jgi:two-component system OmpR family response regulator
MQILLVEDDIPIADIIINGMNDEGIEVNHAADGEKGLKMVLSESYSAAIIDIMLPKLDGLSLIQEMRSRKNDTPVIILSSKISIDDRVKGLEIGSDDYLTKPFAFSELLARLQALIRRSNNQSEPTTLILDDLVLDLLTRNVTRGGRTIDLQPREFALLAYLMSNVGKVISKTMIMKHVWHYNFDPQTNVVEARICKLRDKIDQDFDKKLIHTIRGAGYVIKETP